MESALDDIAFLAMSENRVRILGVLMDEEIHTRDELMEATDVSRPTLARILDDLESRTWITQHGQNCRITPLGMWVYEEFIELLKTIAAERQLREIFQWLPLDVFTFDIRHLSGAEIILIEEHDVTAIVRRILEFHRNGDWIRGVAREAAPEFIENQWELSVQGDTQIELVLTPEAMKITEEHPETIAWFREMLTDGNAEYFIYEDIPISVGIVDDTVGINLADEQGVLHGGIATDDETVYRWAVELFETCREKARPLQPDAIPIR